MAEFWTVEQAQAQAELLAREFSNRQILIHGIGVPNLNVPIGVEYEDRSITPAIRYRKIGIEASDWMKLLTAEAASEQEVLEGTNTEKVVTPARLTEKLNQFGSEILGVPSVSSEQVPSTLILHLETSLDTNNFKLNLPASISLSMASIRIISQENNSIISKIEGGEIGQLINLKRASNFSVVINSSEQIKVSQPFNLSDMERLDNITLQKISPSIWVEISRKKF